MFGTKTSIVSLALLAAATLAAAADPDYFPLQVGNTWIYRVSTPVPTIQTLEVTRGEWFNDHVYYLLRTSTGSETWVRMADDGTLYAWDATEKAEKILAAFGANIGETYASAMHPCNKAAAISSRKEKYKGPVGEFDWALAIEYLPPTCADAGLERELYLPWIGMIYRLETTIAGPRRWDLIYARLGGVAVVSEQEVTFSLSLDKAAYIVNLMPPVSSVPPVPAMTARICFRVVQDEPLRLTFPSGQTYDLVIKDDKGKVVYQWSAGKAFTDVVRQESFGPGERNFLVVVRLADAEGKPLAQGKYGAEAWLTTAGTPVYRATAGFEIKNLY